MFCFREKFLVIFGGIFLGAARGDRGSLQANTKAHLQQVYQHNEVIGIDFISQDIAMESSQSLVKTINAKYILKRHNKIWNDLVKQFTHKALSASVSPTLQVRVSSTGLERSYLAYFNQINEDLMSMDYNIIEILKPIKFISEKT